MILFWGGYDWIKSVWCCYWTWGLLPSYEPPCIMFLTMSQYKMSLKVNLRNLDTIRSSLSCQRLTVSHRSHFSKIWISSGTFYQNWTIQWYDGIPAVLKKKSSIFGQFKSNYNIKKRYFAILSPFWNEQTTQFVAKCHGYPWLETIVLVINIQGHYS